MSRGILQMGVLELTERGRQEVAKWLDRAYGPPPVETGPCPEGDGRFFSGAVDPGIGEALAAIDPLLRERTIARAEAVVQSRFDLLGYRALSFGNPVDWHLDALSGRRSPSVHWSLIDTLDGEALGDARLIWELNRHQWLIALGQAWRLTADERYPETAARLLQEWMAQNPPGVGINWSSSLEIGFRAVSWCWAAFLMRDAPAFAAQRFASLLRAWIAAHAAHVARYLSHYFSPNTHLTGEALALVHVGVLFPELPAAASWRAVGAAILTRETARQVLPDGVYFEQSTGYQRYTVEFYLHFLALAAENGLPVPPSVALAVTRQLDFLLAVRSPSGALPQIGDGDGGFLAPLGDRPATDPSDLFSTAAVLFSRSDYAWAAGGIAPETIWLLGASARASFDRLVPAPPAAPASRLFADGGYAVMASGWGHDAHHLVFDVGPLGCPMTAGHGHADLLSLQASVFGRPAIVDPGTYCYTRHRARRDRFRGTAAHSTVRIDDTDQAEPAGPFSWRRHPAAHLVDWSSGPAGDMASADHDAYVGVTHRRSVAFSRRSHWIVVDDLEGTGEHAVEARFQLAPVPASSGDDGWTRAAVDGARGLLLRTLGGEDLSTRIVEGHDARHGGGWVSPAYGVRVPAPMVVVSGRARLPLRLVTLIVPAADAFAKGPSPASLVETDLLDLGRS